MAAQEPGVCLWALGPWNMANSPWEIKITSFGESLLLSPSTHTQAVPKSPFSLSPPLTSPGNHQPSRTISMLYWAGSQLVLQRVALHMQPLYRNTCPSKHLPATCELVRIFQQTTSTDKNISTVPVKNFSCSCKRRMGSRSIYNMNKGLGKRKYLVYFVTMVTTPFGRPSDFSLLTEWFVTEFQRTVLFIIFWLKWLFFSFVFCLVFGLQNNMAKTWENLLIFFTLPKPLALTNEEEGCSAPKMSSVISMKCLITWPHRTKEETTYFRCILHCSLERKILYLSFKCFAII